MDAYLPYLFLVLSGLFYGVRMVVIKKYQLVNGTALGASLLFASCYGLLCGFIFFAANGFRFEFSWFSFLLAAILALEETCAAIVANRAMALGDVAIYTMFLVSGSTIAPFLYGAIFLKEQPSVLRIVGVCVIVAALLLPIFFRKKDGKKGSLKFYLLCALTFLCDAIFSVGVKIHQTSSAPIASSMFTSYYFGLTCVFSSIAFGVWCIRHKPMNPAGKPYFSWWLLLYVVLFSAFGGSATFLNVYCASFVPATLQAPLLSGLMIIFSAILAWLFCKQKLSLPSLLQIGLCLAGVVLVIF